MNHDHAFLTYLENTVSVVQPHTRGWKKIKEKFGSEVFHNDGQLDREKLGQIIFKEPTKRRLLNSIVHPEIYRTILWKLLLLFLKGIHFKLFHSFLLLIKTH